jgi:hypothetical protein
MALGESLVSPRAVRPLSGYGQGDTTGLARDLVRSSSSPTYVPGRYSTAEPGIGLPAAAYVTMLAAMFVVTEAATAAIRTAYEQEGELFPGVTDNAEAGLRLDHRRIETAPPTEPRGGVR